MQWLKAGMVMKVTGGAIHESSSGTYQDAQILVVMRHTQREDEVESSWVARASMPWDPPISEQGIGLVGTHHAMTACLTICSPSKRWRRY